MRTSMLAGSLAGLLGCVAHVPLQAPPPTAPADERAQAYASLSPAGLHTITTVSVTNNVASVNQSTTLILRNGETVADPNDLIPVVPPESPTAHAAQRASDARASAWKWAGAGLGALTVGGILFGVAGLQESSTDSMGVYHAGGVTPIGVGAIVAMTVGVFVGTFGAVYFGHQASEATAAAFATYDDSLRAQLNMCVAGLQVVPCP